MHLGPCTCNTPRVSQKEFRSSSYMCMHAILLIQWQNEEGGGGGEEEEEKRRGGGESGGGQTEGSIPSL